MAGFALFSTLLGAGIVGLPYAFYHIGLIPGLILILYSCYTVHISCDFYLRIKDITGNQESIYEIGFALFGRPSLFMFATMIMILCSGLLIAYYNLLATICSSLYIDFYNSSGILANDLFYKGMIGVILFPLIFKRTIKELKVVSIILFVSAMIFLVTLMNETINKKPEDISDKFLTDIFSAKLSRNSITSLSIFVFAYVF